VMWVPASCRVMSRPPSGSGIGSSKRHLQDKVQAPSRTPN
jgi:hypothetical protein